jgi:hypothetical protein
VGRSASFPEARPWLCRTVRKALYSCTRAKFYGDVPKHRGARIAGCELQWNWIAPFPGGYAGGLREHISFVDGEIDGGSLKEIDKLVAMLAKLLKEGDLYKAWVSAEDYPLGEIFKRIAKEHETHVSSATTRWWRHKSRDFVVCQDRRTKL